MTLAPGKDHLVDFYAQDERLVERVVAYLVAGLRRGEVAVVVATPAHVAALDAGLSGHGVDPDEVRGSGALVALDAAGALARLCPAGRPERDAFWRHVGPVLRSACAGGRRARVYGEMVRLLWETGDVAGAAALESMWNELAQELDFSLYCSYPAVPADEGRLEDVERICGLHTDVAHRHGWAGGRRAQADYEAHPVSPGAARRFLRGVLAEWGWPDRAGIAELVLTELTTNALVHARSPFRVVLFEHRGRLRLAVEDANRDLPRRYDPGPDACSGRGLALIEALSCEWGCSVRSDGKQVWADLALAEPKGPVEG